MTDNSNKDDNNINPEETINTTNNDRPEETDHVEVDEAEIDPNDDEWEDIDSDEEEEGAEDGEGENDVPIDYDDADDSDEEEKEETDETIKNLPGCPHYKRNCRIKSPCCNLWFGCRHCHNEQQQTHQIDRFAIKEVQCLKCNKEQPVSNQCVECKTQFAHYFCAVCKLYDNDPRKQIFHCDQCGICRVGNRADYFHCGVCNLCLPHSLQSNHKCIAQSANSNCPICCEYMFDSRNPVQILSCGHPMHSKCFNQMRKSGMYTCPICSKSVVDVSAYYRMLDLEIAATPMPAEYANMKVKILCNDCNKKNEVNFHILGLKCPECNGYNTARI